MSQIFQIVLIVSISLLTLIFLTIGIWVILILREIKQVIGRLDNVGNNIEETSEFVKDKIEAGLSMMSLMTVLGSLWEKKGDLLSFNKSDRSNGDAGAENNEDKPSEEAKPKKKSKKRRFFNRKK